MKRKDTKCYFDYSKIDQSAIDVCQMSQSLCIESYCNVFSQRKQTLGKLMRLSLTLGQAFNQTDTIQ